MGGPSALPVPVSHTRTDMSHEHDTTLLPFPAIDTPNTLSLCPSIRFISVPLSRFHTRTLLSKLHVAAVRPSADADTPRTSSS